MNYKFIMKSFLALYVATFSFGFLRGAVVDPYIMAPYMLSVKDLSSFYAYLDIMNFLGIFIIFASFLIMGFLIKEKKFLHLFYIACLAWLSEVPSVLFFEVSYKTWLLNAPIIACCMLAGYGLSLIVAFFIQTKKSSV